MKTASASIALVLTSIVVATPVARADNPMLASATPAAAVTDQQLDKVKGTGSTSLYYGYLGNYYASSAIQSASFANYYNYFGYTGPGNYATNSYYDAYSAANNAANNYYNAWAYSYSFQ